MINVEHELSLTRQAELLSLSRASLYYTPVEVSDADLRLMRRCSPLPVQVKAAGGVRTLARLLEVRVLGVSRVGATASQAILDECRARLG